MPYTTQWTQHGVTWKYTGNLTGEELLQSNINIYGDERFDDLWYQIVDLSEVKSVTVTPLIMRKITHLDMAAAHTNPHIRVAVIGGEQLNKIYSDNACESHWPTQDFNSMEAALAWVHDK
ncbi:MULTISPECIES: hypothetical protein [unclassified Lentimonas]|uniref:hypothetical protein n=1 Tax=unclassified Lentimonas TaxID=2630993 RepID=UPI0013253E6E|nr:MULTISPECIES: hypothetical protein [unclassified Lentimonas]CAA6676961.1 Unannotated [Lentimonas sp. CC4]CAA6686767.1 Unannotated [Lentimonas sp. CC6]CAA6692819.1 Unannotated [Lentimonas sp. CC10]CAA6695538.1 Unannotated [Lentimonas sp. CC19]CAA7069870.1 Unannotated [Lentimonas sp. CC11]